ncbi:hypothetical protein [Clostridium botulinum]|uniref:hypothetical protein n=1 Tax=Clostridium botulinum TaxID=1491 RepID=UPI001E59CF8D|nr:hypothetical protein [Clostridium botulinum]MCD3254339.1 hypothetical protein [Clostridium botulinum C/D]MCD3279839.1 hypothetical protein [Clostridium botulinum C/D]MCD3339618.1 hypothetical protein [Clostridium botulinum C/D]MCD3357478.1 hypothetical protein [Clostridium botulinum C/D]
MSQQYKKMPSEIIQIEDEYTAYCFDEACSYMLTQLQKEEPPQFYFDDEVQTKNNTDLLSFVQTHNQPRKF